MYQQPPPNDPFNQNGMGQYQSARKDGGAVVQEATTYLTDPEAARICEIFAEGLDSGLGYTRILAFLERKGVKATVINRMRRALIEEGISLSEAFARYGILDPAARKLILVAERQGNLPDAFRTQIPIYNTRHERKKHVLGTCVEPVVLFYLSAFILLPLMSNITVIYTSRKGVVSAALEHVLGPAIFGLFAVMFLLGIGYAWLMTPVDFALRDAWSNIWMRMPVVSGASRLYASSLFARYLGSSIGSGMNIFDSIQLAVEASNDPRLNDRLPHALASLEDGVSLSDSLSLVTAIPEDIIEYIGLGEETGRMEEMLERAATIFEERALEAFDRQMKFFTNVLRVLLIFGVLGSVVFKMIGNLSKTFREAMDGAYVLPMLYLRYRFMATIERDEK